MADTPGDDTTRLIPCLADNGSVSPFPLVAVRNVFVLPGGRIDASEVPDLRWWAVLLHLLRNVFVLPGECITPLSHVAITVTCFGLLSNTKRTTCCQGWLVRGVL
jgi:hypothetical protein